MLNSGGTLGTQGVPMNYTGSVVLNGGAISTGQLQPGANATLTISGSMTLNPGTQTQVTPLGQDISLNGNLSGSGSLTAAAASTLSVHLGGNNAGFSGTFGQAGSNNTFFENANAGSGNAAWNLTAGDLQSNVTGTPTIQLGALAGSGGYVGTYSASSATTFSIGALNSNTTFSGTIINKSGTTAIAKVGAGTLTLTGSNTYTGGTSINMGTLSFANGSLSGSGAVTFTGNSTLHWYGGNTQDLSNRFAMTGGIAVTLDTNGNNVTLASSIGSNSSAGLVKAGAGALLLNNANTYSGGTTVSGGTLQLGNVQSLGTGGLTANNGTVDLAGFSPTVASLGGAAGVITVSGASNSTLTVNQATSTVFGGSLNDGPAAHVGLIKIGGGTLDLTGASVMSSHTDISGGVLQVDGSLSVPSLNVNDPAQLAGSGRIGVNSADGLLYRSTAVSSFGGAISGAGPLEIDSGSLTLSGSSGYLGGTTVQGGALVLANTSGSALGSGDVFLNGGLLASVPGNAGMISGNVWAGSGLHQIAPGGIGAVGTLSIGGSLGLSGSSTLDIDIAGGASGLLTIGGALSVNGTATIDFTSGGVLSNSYTLATFGNSTATAGNFTLVGAPSGYGLQVTGNDLVLGQLGPAAWTASGTGNWSVGGNWSTGSAPNGAGKGAVINQPTTAAVGIVLDSPVTLGTLVFGNSSGATPATGYTFSGSTLTMDNSGGSATITVTDGAHVIAAPISLNSDLVVSPSAGSTLAINGDISESGVASLTLADSGQLILGGNNSYQGGTIVEAGLLVATSNGSIPDNTGLVIGANGTFVFDPTQAGSAAASPAVSSATAPVPEPGTLLLVLAAISSAAIYRRFSRPY